MAKEKKNIQVEEKIDTPTVTAAKNFFRNKLAVVGLIVFISVILFVFIVSSLTEFNAYSNQPILRNVQPGYGYLDYGSDVENADIVKVVSGITFSAALDSEGKIHYWGIDNNNVLNPDEETLKKLEENTFVDVAAGDRHIIALTDKGEIVGWGHSSFGQTSLDAVLEDAGGGDSYVSCPPGGCPESITANNPAARLSTEKIVKIAGGELFSLALTENGYLFVWGSTMSNKMDRIPEDLQGRIKDFETSSTAVILLMDDDTVEVYGTTGNVQSRGIPEAVQDGSKQIVDVAITFKNAFALDSEGTVYSWGPSNYSVVNLPQFDGRVTQIDAGREHAVALLENGSVVAWGDNSYGQTETPNITDATAVYADFFQNYAANSEGKLTAWGNNGFLIGSDEYGRDLFTRLVHGGRVSLYVGAIAVVIQIIIGVIVGMISGFYGGWIDNLLMRFAEIIGSFPFYPLVITLSAMLPLGVPASTRMVLIMVILGVIGWPGIARLVRGQILQEREKDFVMAAKSLGIVGKDIVVKHILPNVLNIVIVQITLGYAGSLLSEAGLSFLGFGVPFPYPSWGNMLSDAQAASVIEAYWWRWVFPGLMVFITALSINLIGDGLRDALDPKSNEK